MRKTTFFDKQAVTFEDLRITTTITVTVVNKSNFLDLRKENEKKDKELKKKKKKKIKKIKKIEKK